MIALAFLCLIILLALTAPLLSQITGLQPEAQFLDNQFASPSLSHPFGTDELGQDIFIRVLYGARISLLVGLLGALVSLILGTAYGAVSGYMGGKVDNVMMRIVEVIYSLPFLFLIILVITIIPQDISDQYNILIIFMILGLVQWLTLARIVRGQVLSLKHSEFVMAARATGVGGTGIILRHLIPNLTGQLIVYTSLTVPRIILQESFLSFLGLGVKTASWGVLVRDAMKQLNPVEITWWPVVFPCLIMSLALLSLNFIGEGLREAFSPDASPDNA